MRYFSGFCLSGEEELFSQILIESDYTLAGFSYGAILATEEAIKSKERVDRLILISPAFFQNRAKRFIDLQLKAWERDKSNYIKSFLKSCSYPANFSLKKYLKVGSKEELEYLLTYRWDREKLNSLSQRGVDIEIFIGQKDKIVDTEDVLEFFGDIATVYLFKEASHILR